MRARRFGTATMGVVLVVVAACGGSKSAANSGDFASASSGGDKGVEAAIRKDSDFSCPAAAANVGVEAKLPAGHKLQVVTTVAPITSIVANVAGSAADVHGIIPEGEDSHTYEPKPSVAELMAKADVIFVNGLSLEDPTKELAEKNVAAAGQVVEFGSRTLTPDQYIFDFSFPRDGGKPNPHLWTNPPMSRCYAVIAAAALAKADPANASTYQANAAKLEAKIDQLDGLFKAASDKMPAANRVLLTYHDAYAYFAAHYRWKILGAIQVSNFEEPTPKEVASLIQQVKKEKVPAIFGSEVFPSSVLAQIGKEARVAYVDKLRDDDLPGAPGDPDHSYLGLVKTDFVTMVGSLGGDPSDLKAFDASDVAPDKAVYEQ